MPLTTTVFDQRPMMGGGLARICASVSEWKLIICQSLVKYLKRFQPIGQFVLKLSH